MAFLKAMVILVGFLALIGGGLCVATNLEVMPNAVVIIIALSVAVGGGWLMYWGIDSLRTDEREAKNIKPPNDRPDAD